jgi:hypothetical protein
MTPALDTDGTLRSRYECKYLVPAESLPALRSYFASFMAHDAHALRTPDRRYVVTSLYLDSPRLVLYQGTLDGAKNRHKLRLRTYADGADAPVYCEVKKRMNGVIYKRRAKVPRAAAQSFLAGDGFALERAAPVADTREFALLARAILAEPALRVRYMREAFESTGPDPVRVTFDTDLAWAPSPRGELEGAGGEWFGTPLTDPILEVKFTNTFPAWLAEMVRRFGLSRRSVAKYVVCVNAARRRPCGDLRFVAS